MKILGIDNFVLERIKVQPVTNAEFDKAKEVADRVVAYNQQALDYKSKKLKALYNAAYYYYKAFMNNSAYNYNKVDVAYSHTRDTRFAAWSKTLAGQELLKKHEARANSKTIKEPKLFATIYCAFEMYGKDSSYEASKIIRYYMDRLIYQYNTTDDDIINIFFE